MPVVDTILCRQIIKAVGRGSVAGGGPGRLGDAGECVVNDGQNRPTPNLHVAIEGLRWNRTVVRARRSYRRVNESHEPSNGLRGARSSPSG
jgi:hypothetical protein